MAAKVGGAAPAIPHSWSFESWPPGVFPGDAQKAKYLFRANQRELMAEGAVCRVGRTLVFFGAQYDRWLQRRRGNVAGFKRGACVSRDARDAALT